MNDDFAKKVRSAAIAGWWTLLIGAIFVTIQWVAYLHIMRRKPDWVLAVWGSGDVTWSTVQVMWLWFVGVFKIILWSMALVVIWLSLWAHGLRKL
jgi:hypothetical protein